MSKRTVKFIVLAGGIAIFSAIMAIMYAPGGRSVTRQLTGQDPVETEQEKLWEQTQELRAEGKYEAAIAKLETLLAAGDTAGKGGYSGQALQVMAEIKQEMDDNPDEIIDLYSRIINQYKGTALAGIAAAAIGAMADNQRALEIAQSFYDSAPDDPETLKVFSVAIQAFKQAEQWEQAGKECRRVIKAYPGNDLGGRAANELLSLTEEQKTPTELLDQCTALMQEYPDKKVGLAALHTALGYYRSQKDNNGLAVFCKAVIANHPGTDIAAQASSRLAQVNYDAGAYLSAVSLITGEQADIEGILAAKDNLPDEANLSLLDQRITSWIEASEANRQKPKAELLYQSLADKVFEQQKSILAIRWYMKAAQAVGYKLPLETQFSTEEDFTYQQAQTYSPQQLSQKASFWKAFVLWSQNRIELALPVFQELIDHAPEAPEAAQGAFLLANYYTRQGDYLSAERTISVVEKTYSYNDSVRQLSQKIQSAVEMIRRAEKAIETLNNSLANTQEPEAKARLLMQIADLQINLKRYESAAKTLLQIPDLASGSPQAPQAMLKAAQLVYSQLGNQTWAKTILDGLFLSFPDSDAAWSALELAKLVNPGT